MHLPEQRRSLTFRLLPEQHLANIAGFKEDPATQQYQRRRAGQQHPTAERADFCRRDVGNIGQQRTLQFNHHRFPVGNVVLLRQLVEPRLVQRPVQTIAIRLRLPLPRKIEQCQRPGQHQERRQ